MRLDWLPSDVIKVIATRDGRSREYIPSRRFAMMIDILLDLEAQGKITENRQGWVELYYDGRRVQCQTKEPGGVRKDRKGDASYDPSVATR